jgi:hypothetical protein
LINYARSHFETQFARDIAMNAVRGSWKRDAIFGDSLEICDSCGVLMAVPYALYPLITACTEAYPPAPRMRPFCRHCLR